MRVLTLFYIVFVANSAFSQQSFEFSKRKQKKVIESLNAADDMFLDFRETTKRDSLFLSQCYVLYNKAGRYSPENEYVTKRILEIQKLILLDNIQRNFVHVADSCFQKGEFLVARDLYQLSIDELRIGGVDYSFMIPRILLCNDILEINNQRFLETALQIDKLIKKSFTCSNYIEVIELIIFEIKNSPNSNYLIYQAKIITGYKPKYFEPYRIGQNGNWQGGKWQGCDSIEYRNFQVKQNELKLIVK
jgi:hypothetical protein